MGATDFSTQWSIASSNARSSSGPHSCSMSVLIIGLSVVDLVFHRVTALGDQHGAIEGADQLAVLVEAVGAAGDDAGAGARLGFALFQHFRFGHQRVADEQRMR